jgi:glycosyltransferase involved in cell wall biosynthesis
MEAAALGTPVVCNDLPIYRETLENIPVYANVNDRYLWIRTIDHLAKDPEGRGGQASEFTPPSWEAHFKVALTRI